MIRAAIVGLDVVGAATSSPACREARQSASRRRTPSSKTTAAEFYAEAGLWWVDSLDAVLGDGAIGAAVGQWGRIYRAERPR
jgi:hypothetical protein